MRLIDADALKYKNLAEVNGKLTYVLTAEEIDNAPTVEAIPTELHEKIMDKTTGELLECQSNLRPQGEWIEVKPHQSDLEDGIDYREECSVCHEPNRHYDFDEYHNIKSATYYKTKFCPNCGADMRPKPNQFRDCENCVHHSDKGCEVWKCEFKRRSS